MHFSPESLTPLKRMSSLCTRRNALSGSSPEPSNQGRSSPSAAAMASAGLGSEVHVLGARGPTTVTLAKRSTPSSFRSHGGPGGPVSGRLTPLASTCQSYCTITPRLSSSLAASPSSRARLISAASQLHGRATASVSTNSQRMLNWNRQRKTRARAYQESINSRNTPTPARAISTAQPGCSLKANQWNRSDSHSKPSTAMRTTSTRRPGVGRNQRRRDGAAGWNSATLMGCRPADPAKPDPVVAQRFRDRFRVFDR